MASCFVGYFLMFALTWQTLHAFSMYSHKGLVLSCGQSQCKMLRDSLTKLQTRSRQQLKKSNNLIMASEDLTRRTALIASIAALLTCGQPHVNFPCCPQMVQMNNCFRRSIKYLISNMF